MFDAPLTSLSFLTFCSGMDESTLPKRTPKPSSKSVDPMNEMATNTPRKTPTPHEMAKRAATAAKSAATKLANKEKRLREASLSRSTAGADSGTPSETSSDSTLGARRAEPPRSATSATRGATTPLSTASSLNSLNFSSPSSLPRPTSTLVISSPLRYRSASEIAASAPPSTTSPLRSGAPPIREEQAEGGQQGNSQAHPWPLPFASPPDELDTEVSYGEENGNAFFQGPQSLAGIMLRTDTSQLTSHRGPPTYVSLLGGGSVRSYQDESGVVLQRTSYADQESQLAPYGSLLKRSFEQDGSPAALGLSLDGSGGQHRDKRPALVFASSASARGNPSIAAPVFSPEVANGYALSSAGFSGFLAPPLVARDALEQLGSSIAPSSHGLQETWSHTASPLFSTDSSSAWLSTNLDPNSFPQPNTQPGEGVNVFSSQSPGVPITNHFPEGPPHDLLTPVSSESSSPSPPLDLQVPLAANSTTTAPAASIEVVDDPPATAPDAKSRKKSQKRLTITQFTGDKTFGRIHSEVNREIQLYLIMTDGFPVTVVLEAEIQKMIREAFKEYPDLPVKELPKAAVKTLVHSASSFRGSMKKYAVGVVPTLYRYHHHLLAGDRAAVKKAVAAALKDSSYMFSDWENYIVNKSRSGTLCHPAILSMLKGYLQSADALPYADELAPHFEEISAETITFCLTLIQHVLHLHETGVTVAIDFSVDKYRTCYADTLRWVDTWAAREDRKLQWGEVTSALSSAALEILDGSSGAGEQGVQNAAIPMLDTD